jgi:RNA polymerase-binding transcription factor DksA
VASYDAETVEARLAERLAELQHTREAVRRDAEGMTDSELAHLGNHPADEGSEMYERELDSTTEVFLSEEERRIAEARRALANGTYGTCVSCGSEIPVERLEVVPEAVRCIDCQRGLDGVHRQANAPRPD